jgi:hypothetical protein
LCATFNSRSKNQALAIFQPLAKEQTQCRGNYTLEQTKCSCQNTKKIANFSYGVGLQSLGENVVKSKGEGKMEQWGRM